MNQTQASTSKMFKRVSSSMGSTIDVEMDVGMDEVKKIRLDQPSTSTGVDANSTSKACNAYNMSCLKEVVDNLETSGGGLKRNLHGSEFQLGMLMLVLWRAYIRKYHNFRLATELEAAEKFDDIVIMSRENETDKWALRLIQAKHKEGKIIPKIDRANLMAENGSDFALPKYFQSFIKIQRRCIQKSLNCPFSNADIQGVLLVTNTDLKTEELKNSFEVVGNHHGIQNDELLGVDSTPNSVTYKISELENDPLRRDLEQILRRSSDFNQLVLTIVKSILNGEQLNKTITVIKEFIHPLMRDIFDCEKENGKHILKFSQAFFDTDKSSAEVDKFRDALSEEIAFRTTCWKVKVRNTFGGSSTSLSDELLQKLAKVLAQTINDNSELQIQDCLGAHQILLEQVINNETGKFYSKFIENKGNKMVKLRDFLKKETGMAYFKLASVQIKISSELSAFSMSADKYVLNKIADVFALQLQVQGWSSPSLEELLPADMIAYENVLATKVLDVYKGELLDSFKSGSIENDPKFDTKEFRRILIEKLCTLFPVKKKQAEALLKKARIHVSKELANDFKFDQNPIIKDPVEFSQQFYQILKPLVSECESSHLNAKIEETTLNLTLDAAERFNQNICVLGNRRVLVKQSEKIQLSTNFTESTTKLLGNLEEFRKQLITLFGKVQFNLISKFVFDIQIQACQSAFQTLPQPFDESQFEEFIKKFRLIVKYPNREELMKTIQCEMEKEFRFQMSRVPKAVYYEQLKNWMSNRNCTFYSAQHATELFEGIKKDLKHWTLNGVSEAYFSNTPKKYSFQTMESRVRSFLSDEHDQILILTFDEIALGRIRTVETFLKLQRDNSELLQKSNINSFQKSTIESFQKYTRKLGYIFFTLDQLEDSKFQERFALSSQDCQLWNLLVIECDLLKPGNTLKRLNMLMELNVSNRKIIFVANQMLSINPNLHCRQEKIETRFCDLTKQSQQAIAENETICLQETDRGLGDLLDDCSKQLVDASILANIIAEVPIKVGNGLVLSEGYNELFYIEREIDRSVEIKEDVLRNFDDIIILSEFEKDFIEAREKHAGDHAKNIHWLCKRSEKLFWMETYRSIAKLVEYRVNKIDSNAEPNEAPDFGKNLLEHELIAPAEHQKLMIISNTAGMGKTTILSNISKLLKSSFTNLWILRIDLNNYSDFFDQKLESCEGDTTSLQKNSAVDFLIELLNSSEQSKLATDFECNVLKDSLLRKSKLQVALLLDGFDEISPDFTNIVLDLVQSLRLTNLQWLIITTRPCTQKTLEVRLGTFACRMNEFSRTEQSQFLTKFWRSRLSAEMNWSDACEYRLSVYVDAILNTYSETLNDSHMQFTGIPLQLRLLAEVFEENRDGSQWNGCKEYIMSTEEIPKFQQHLDVCDLFGQFVEKKFNIYYREKSLHSVTSTAAKREFRNAFNTFVEQHEKMALFLIFKGDDLRTLFENFGGFEESMNEIRKYIALIKAGEERRGIVNQVIDGKPHFIHGSFADYFAAHYLSKILFKITSQPQPLYEFMIPKAAGTTANTTKGIQYFFNSWLAKRSGDISEKVKYDFGKFVADLGVRRDKDGHAIICFSAPCFGNNTEIIRLICECLKTYCDRECCREQLLEILNFNNEALIDAFTSSAFGYDNDMKAMQIFVEYGANLIAFISEESYLMNERPAAWFQMWRCFLLHADEMRMDVDSLLFHIWPTFDYAIHLGYFGFCGFLIERGLRLDKTDYQGKFPLHTAVRTGDIETVQWLIDENINLSLCDKSGRNVLHCACKAGKLEIAKLLVEDLNSGGAGLDINFKAKYGRTILHTAVSSHNTDILQWILNEGIDINSPDDLGCTPLHIAAKKGNLETVKWLVSKGAYINAITMHDTTVFHLAALSNTSQTCLWLIDQNLNVDILNAKKMIPIQLAAMKGHLDVVRKLLTGRQPGYGTHENGDTLLHFAAKSGKVDICEWLLACDQMRNAGLDVNSVGEGGKRMIHLAAEKSLGLVKWLVESPRGTNINAITMDGDSVLHLAARSSTSETCLWLIDQNLNADLLNAKRMIPIQLAAMKGHLDVVRKLLTGRQPGYGTHENGDTLLHFAAKSGKVDICEWLLECDQMRNAGLDVNSVGKGGKRMIHLAAEKSLGLVKWLVESPRGTNINAITMDGDSVLHLAARSSTSKTCLWLIDQNLNADLLNAKRMIPIQLAAMKGHLDVVRKLLTGRQPGYGTHENGDTLLHFAAKSGKVDICEWLLECDQMRNAGLDVNSIGEGGRRMIHLAAEKSLDLVEWLLGIGAETSFVDNEGLSVQDYVNRLR